MAPHPDHEKLKLDARDRMGLLLVALRDCIGAVSWRPYHEEVSVL